LIDNNSKSFYSKHWSLKISRNFTWNIQVLK
jgi:hypothetical protein